MRASALADILFTNFAKLSSIMNLTLVPYGNAHCASKFPVPLESIMNCSKSDYGNELEHKMALKTNALQPPHGYVPWITINGVHTEAIEKEAERDLVKLICDTYKVSINRV
ncbi:gamma-interferon-inducible lysosomal thiol reductase [Plakobranchus ocellatus]|uniref:Gamma-interferon-inducible lysosomal thiol reductase n=1 Tax=Plakobranchus ocellatus TaxID=259542 RepID=A0AAV3YQN9_9GAST|nr:gamma-interferon-inducible lysosomal thiol reductase [Plakobranchus ocellatus]